MSINAPVSGGIASVGDGGSLRGCGCNASSLTAVAVVDVGCAYVGAGEFATGGVVEAADTLCRRWRQFRRRTRPESVRNSYERVSGRVLMITRVLTRETVLCSILTDWPGSKGLRHCLLHLQARH